MDSYGFLWVPMDSYGFLWVPMYSYGILWIPSAFRWIPDIPMDSYVFLRIPMDSYRIPMHSYVFLWIPMDSFVFLWIPVDPTGLIWIPMYAYGLIWIAMNSCVLLRARQKKPCQAARYLAGAFRKLSGLGPSGVLCILVFLSAPFVSSVFKDFYGFPWIPMYSYGLL